MPNVLIGFSLGGRSELLASGSWRADRFPSGEMTLAAESSIVNGEGSEMNGVVRSSDRPTHIAFDSP
jgi:hypothetical protein